MDTVLSVGGAMKTTKTFKQVTAILESNDASRMTGVTPRDSDKELVIQILQRCRGMNMTVEQVGIMRSINFESIRRCRQKLQSQGKYLGSPEIMKKRRVKGYELEQVTPVESAQGIQRRVEENA